MVLPTGTITMSDVNNEIGQSSSANIDLNSAAVRRLSGLTTSGTSHSMDNLRGKGATLSSLGGFYSAVSNQTGTVTLDLNFASDGTWGRTATGPAGFTTNGSPTAGNWFALGSTANIGNYYWIRFTATVLVTAGTGSYTASTGWLSLSSTRSITASVSGANAERDIRYVVEIASDSAGTYIRASATTELDAVKN